MSTKTNDITKYAMTEELRNKFEDHAVGILELVFEATLEAKTIDPVPSQNAFKAGIRHATEGLAVKASNKTIEIMYNASVLDGKTKAECLTAVDVAYKTDAQEAKKRRLAKSIKDNRAKALALAAEAKALEPKSEDVEPEPKPEDVEPEPKAKAPTDVTITISVDRVTKELRRILSGPSIDLRKAIEGLVVRLDIYTKECTTNA